MLVSYLGFKMTIDEKRKIEKNIEKIKNKNDIKLVDIVFKSISSAAGKNKLRNKPGKDFVKKFTLKLNPDDEVFLSQCLEEYSKENSLTIKESFIKIMTGPMKRGPVKERLK